MSGTGTLKLQYDSGASGANLDYIQLTRTTLSE